MGGNSPIIVWETPDLHSAATLIVQSAFTTAGQRCTAARRLIVDEKPYEPLIETLNKLVARLIVGEPHADLAPFMGFVINTDAADQLTERFLALIMRRCPPHSHPAPTTTRRRPSSEPGGEDR